MSIFVGGTLDNLLFDRNLSRNSHGLDLPFSKTSKTPTTPDLGSRQWNSEFFRTVATPKSTMNYSVLGILDLLNSDESPEESKSESRSSSLAEDSRGLSTGIRASRLLCSQIHPHILQNKKLIDIALRRKSASKRLGDCQATESGSSKLHLKLLEAGLRVRLILCPSVHEIYRQLAPHTARRTKFFHVSFDEASQTLFGSEISADSKDQQHFDVHFAGGSEKPVVKRVRLIDSNLVNLAGVSSKVLKSFQIGNEAVPPSPNKEPGMVTTFNLLDTAVASLFQTTDYTLIRVTRASSNTEDGSVLLKLESANPGDTRLIDDREFMDDMVASLGKVGQSPNNLFIKKVVARPRYKSDMKIYIVPTDDIVLLYVDKRIFERDLINGVLEIDSPPDRCIYTTFPVSEILQDFREMVAQSSRLGEVTQDSC